MISSCCLDSCLLTRVCRSWDTLWDLDSWSVTPVTTARLFLLSRCLGSLFYAPSLRAMMFVKQGICCLWSSQERFAQGSTPQQRASFVASVSWNNMLASLCSSEPYFPLVFKVPGEAQSYWWNLQGHLCMGFELILWFTSIGTVICQK